MLVERKGYANYFFNLQQQQAFIDSLRSQFPAGGDAKRATWEIEGQTAAPESLPVRVRLDDEKRALVVGDLAFEAGTRADMYDEVDAGSPAGLLPALDAWRRMIETGPEQFGESYYVGEMPLAGERPLRHCMLGIDGEMEVRWLSHPETRLIEVIEVFADRDGDPAELWFYRDSDDPNSPPDRVELRYGVDTVLAFKVTSWKRAAESEGDAEKADELKAETSP